MSVSESLTARSEGRKTGNGLLLKTKSEIAGSNCKEQKEEMNMNFDEFVKEMQENIKTYLPEWYENATVDVFQNQKLNDSYLGL